MIVAFEVHMSRKDTAEVLRKFLRKTKVATLTTLLNVMGVNSRVSVFRQLKKLGYYSSFSHSGKYYTLHGIPQFDKQGLWFYKEVGFTRDRTLIDTVLRLLEKSRSGMTHGELKLILGIDVFNTLTALTKEDRIRRQGMENGRFVYVSAGENGERQLDVRARSMQRSAFPSDAQAVLILVELVKSPFSSVKDLVRSLRLKGVKIAEKSVENLLARHDLLKKTSVTKQ